MMASTIHASIAMEVDEIHEQFAANAAREAARMPTGIRSQARGKDGNVPRGNQFVALQQQRRKKEGGEGEVSIGIALEDRQVVLTPSQGRALISCRTLPRPSASRLRCVENRRSSLRSSSVSE